MGASGLLGHTLLARLCAQRHCSVAGTVRSKALLGSIMPRRLHELLVEGVDAADFRSIERAVQATRPEVIVNCIGLIRQRPEGRQPLACIEINARLPHLLLALAQKTGCRLIHYSTDCVFDGTKAAPYTEDDPPTAKDVYGLSKYLGEVREAPALTLRTSVIGPEIHNKLSLLEWFLAQRGAVTGYTKAIFTGLPAAEHARVLSEYVLPRPDLTGLYHVAARPISKYELLALVAKEYNKQADLIALDGPGESKILDAGRFAAATGYIPAEWPQLIREMHAFHRQYSKESP